MYTEEPPADTPAAAALPSTEDLECVKNEEYKIWKKQSPFLYDLCVSKAMPSPSASVEWFPANEPWLSEGTGFAAGFSTYSLLLTASELVVPANAVFSARCELPRATATAEQITQRRESGKEIPVVEPRTLLDLGTGNFPFVARYVPQTPQLVAAAGKHGFLCCFKDNAALCDLTYHKGDIYNLSWSPHVAGMLASVSTDGSAALWDVNKGDTNPSHMFAGDNTVGGAESTAQCLNAVEFAPLNAHELVTAGDGRTIQFWDTRTDLTKVVRAITDAHSTGITALNYSPHHEFLLATGSADGAVSIWDVRMSSASLLGLQADAGPVNSLKWSVHEPSVFATGGADAQVKVWDLSRHSQTQTPAEEEEGPPELMFIHGGHLGSISDISWHPVLPWTLCSVAEDSLVGIWKISDAIVNAVPN